MPASSNDKVILLVLDAFGPELVDAERTPTICRLGREGAMAIAGGIADLVASTAPGHAALLTGVTSVHHGVHANRVFDAQGSVLEDVRVRVPTILERARSAGLGAAILVSDPDVLNTVNGHHADLAWPRAANLAADADPATGYMPDELTADAALGAIEQGHDLVFVQLQAPDTVAHAQGIDSEAAFLTHRVVDRLVDRIAAALEPAWDQTVLAVLSDHRAENITDPEPIELGRALEGLAAVAIDGSAALVRPLPGQLDRAIRATRAVAGIDAVLALGEGDLLAWAVPGRAFGRADSNLSRAAHGNGTTRPCLAILAGGHPIVAARAAAVRHGTPFLGLWPRLAAEVLRLPAPGNDP
jgi:predicted AlkP superfamily pyrophosphatase or phosphodiesterase